MRLQILYTVLSAFLTTAVFVNAVRGEFVDNSDMVKWVGISVAVTLFFASFFAIDTWLLFRAVLER